MIDTTETEHGIIRSWVLSGHEQGLLGERSVAEIYGEGAVIKSYFIGSPTLVGSLHPDGSRMAVSIENYRAANEPASREIVKRFDEICAIKFPPRKQLVRRDKPADTPAAAPEAAQAPGGFDLMAEQPAPAPALQKRLVRREEPKAAAEPAPLLRKRGSPS